MAMLGPADQETLRAAFGKMTRSVRLLFFTQAFGCETCLDTRQILDELPPLSDRVTIEEVNLVLEGDKAKTYGVDRAPSIAVVGDDGSGAPVDSRIRFLGAPSGYEFVSLVQAILLVGGRPTGITEANLQRLAAVDRPLTMQVFTTPTWPHCPRAVSLAHEMAFANTHITAIAVEATEFPDLARKYQVNGVPKTVVNDELEILGALPQDAFIEQALSGVTKN